MVRYRSPALKPIDAITKFMVIELDYSAFRHKFDIKTDLAIQISMAIIAGPENYVKTDYIFELNEFSDSIAFVYINDCFTCTIIFEYDFGKSFAFLFSVCQKYHL